MARIIWQKVELYWKIYATPITPVNGDNLLQIIGGYGPVRFELTLPKELA